MASTEPMLQRPLAYTPKAPAPAPADSRAGERCPRCTSTDTKFCYYNNYNTAQPRHFCRSCRRYWTLGGSLRNVPVGGASRKRPRPFPTTPPPPPSLPRTASMPQPRDHHSAAQTPSASASAFKLQSQAWLGSLLGAPLLEGRIAATDMGCSYAGGPLHGSTATAQPGSVMWPFPLVEGAASSWTLGTGDCCVAAPPPVPLVWPDFDAAQLI